MIGSDHDADDEEPVPRPQQHHQSNPRHGNTPLCSDNRSGAKPWQLGFYNGDEADLLSDTRTAFGRDTVLVNAYFPARERLSHAVALWKETLDNNPDCEWSSILCILAR